nr:immunoglobulin light chain junction region [Macaca mulatta]
DYYCQSYDSSSVF